jgi:cysteine desulfurase
MIMVKRKIIYLDDAASTRVSTEVVNEMEKYYLKEYGNPSSYHDMGEMARKGVEKVRKEIGMELGCKAESIIFTSGSTESNNLAFFGMARKSNKKKIIISAIEHSSIFAICDELKKEGFEIVEIGVDKDGRINMDELSKTIDKNTLLVSVMHVNNEIGVIQDIAKIGKLCQSRNVFYHSDCAQSFGKLKIDVNGMGVDLLTASAHKIGGPKGIGILFVKKGITLNPIVYGGGQEKSLRGGTENVPGIVGFGKALEISKKFDFDRVMKVRDFFIYRLEKLGGKINGSLENRVYNNVNVSFSGFDGEDFVLALSLKGVMCSTGSACENFKDRDSKVLKAIGLSNKEIDGSLRFSLSKDISRNDVEFVMKELRKLLK